MATLAAVLMLSPAARAKELTALKLLYVGGERTEQFVPFLKQHVAQVETRNREQFNPADAASFDVVLLDWPQNGKNDVVGLMNQRDKASRTRQELKSPLGKRQDWSKPTVLLGSAGLNLAVSWNLKGGSGCTCMDPLAYDLRSHDIFTRPFKIDRSKSVRIPTPPDFQNEIKADQIEVLPLVDDYKRQWKAGWCSYAYDFPSNPELEFFCGGVNHKTPTAAGFWRQGNLLHFGFEQSPAEMNENGRHLLLNAIAYISHFSEDRPIAITPSVFAGPVARSRSSVARALRNKEYQLDWLKQDFSPELWAKLEPLGRDKMVEWAQQNAKFLHPNSNQQLELDEDLLAENIAFDQPEFFPKMLAALHDGGAASARAQRLLRRYVPVGPANGSATDWQAWWDTNKSYAFASDSGDYCWYIDPLAKKRAIPTTELRGSSRADQGEAMAKK